MFPEQVEEYGQRGIRCMAVARTDAEGQWHMLGLLTFLDPPRPDTKATLETALHYGVQTRLVRLQLMNFTEKIDAPNFEKMYAEAATDQGKC